MPFQEVMRDLKGYLTKEEIEDVLKHETNPTYQLMMEVLWNSGIRIEELVGGILRRTKKIKDALGNIIKKENFTVECTGLLAENLDKENSVLIVPWLKKSTRYLSYRRVPITKTCMEKLVKYVEEKNIKNKDRIFPFTRFQAWRVVKKAGERIGFQSFGTKGKGLHPHHFRHSLSIHLIKNGMPIEKLKEILGHSSVSSTGFYLQFKGSEVEEDYHKIMG